MTDDNYTTKICTRCKKDYPAAREFFYKHVGMVDGLHAKCIPCTSKDQKIYRASRRDAILQRKKEHYQENRERLLEVAKHRRLDPEYQKWTKEYLARFFKTAHGRLIHTVCDARRRARKIALPDSFAKENWFFCLNYWAYACAVCGNQEGFLWRLAADHWIPMVDQERCPGTVPWNMLPLCHGQGGCNNSKHGSDPIVWLEKKLGKVKARKKMAEIAAYFSIAKSR